MHPSDLDLRELLSLEPKGGTIRFAGQRALIVDAAALGLLRKELIEGMGLTAARVLLVRFGYAQGWRTAESLRRELPWDDLADWRQAAGRLHALRGLVRLEPVLPGEGEAALAEALLLDSYEAEQHLLHLGRSAGPVCFTLTGFAAGYLSHANGRPVLAREECCVARGDPVCRMVARFREDWAGREPPLDAGPLDAALAALGDSIEAGERRAAREARLGARAAPEAEPAGIVARSQAMRRVVDLARRVAKVESTVLVTGESGTGKERIAELVHTDSPRAAGPFVAVDCGAVTETLLESELFGHARGAFTGATQDRVGLFEAASRGTLFLDEVGEMSLGMQTKLLQALQELEVRRVGESQTRKIDVRVICATNRELARDVEAGRFRRDLYYRLAVIELRIPPLRERAEDVLPLARALLEGIARRMGKEAHGISPRAADQLLRHPWPGNVRELENALEQALALAEGGRIEWRDLPEPVRAGQGPEAAAPPGARTFEQIEREAILATLAAHGGNQARTAAALGIGTATLYRKLKRWRAEKRI